MQFLPTPQPKSKTLISSYLSNRGIKSTTVFIGLISQLPSLYSSALEYISICDFLSFLRISLISFLPFFVSFIFTPLIYHFFDLRYELFFIGNIINIFWCKILLANPSKAYSATTESLSVQRIIPVGLLDSSSFTIC